MFVPIEINQDDLLSAYSMSKEEIENVADFTVKEITAKFYERWVEEAELSLHSTRQRYIENLSLIDSGRMTGAVVLDYTKDPLIRMIEEGIGAFDMKTNFERSDKVKHNSKGGWYLTIPLSFGAPDTIGDSLGGVTNLPKEVYSVVKKQEVSPITGMSKGLSSTQVPEAYKAPQSRQKIEVPKSKSFEAYTHKSSIYQGVFKQTDKVTGQSSYKSFRRVGENSDSNSWVFPGISEMNLASRAMDRLDASMEIELTRAIDNALSQFGFE